MSDDFWVQGLELIKNNFLVLIIVIYLLISALILYLVLSVVTRLLKKLWALLIGKISKQNSPPLTAAFGQDITTRLIGLGISAWMFPTVIPQIVFVVLNSAQQFLSSLLNNITSDVGRTLTLCDVTENSRELSNCIGTLGFNLLESLSTGAVKVFSEIKNFPITELVLFLSFWVLAARIIDYLRTPGQSSSDKSRVLVWTQHLIRYFNLNRNTITIDSVLFKNAIFLLILGLGIYLSMAAIAAIPRLQEKTDASQETSPENLKVELTAVLNQFFADISGDNTPNDDNPFAPLDNMVAAANEEEPTQEAAPPASNNQLPENNGAAPPNAAGVIPVNTEIISNTIPISQAVNLSETEISATPTAPPPTPIQLSANNFSPEDIAFVKPMIDRAKEAHNNLIADWIELTASTQDNLENTKEIAIRTYKLSNLERKGNREQAQHYLLISNWFNVQLANTKTFLTACRSDMRGLDRNLQRFSEQMLTLVQVKHSLDNQLKLVSYSSPNYESQVIELTDQRLELWNERRKLQDSVLGAIRSVADRCQPYSLKIGSVAPDRPAFGSSLLGPFAPVASWLLQTESLPLALITGMLGFGLLGSASSTFIRNRTPKPERLFVTDLIGVVIRGSSAAVVVFLAVEGGLAIFAVGSSEPNPYVLLLTCLVAAVFSEKVWDWAQKYLAEKFTQNPSADTPPPSSPPPPANPPSPPNPPTPSEPEHAG